MRGPFRIEGYAIASADGMIADATGFMPDSLKIEADQRFYARGARSVRRWLRTAACRTSANPTRTLAGA